MQRVVSVNGFGGVGKSTCCTLLYEHLRSVAVIRADEVSIVKPRAINEKFSRIKIENGAAVIRNFLREGFEYVVCDGFIWSQRELDTFAMLLHDQAAELFVFWLHADHALRQKRVRVRARDEADNAQFLKEVEATIPDPWPLQLTEGHCERIEVGGISTAVVVSHIVQSLRISRGP